MRKLIRGVAIPALLLSIAVGGWFAWIQLFDPWYRSEARITCTPFEVPEFDVRRGSETADQRWGRLIEHQIQELLAEETLFAAVRWPSVQNTDWFRSVGYKDAAAVADLSRRVTARREPRWSSVFVVEIVLPDDADAQTVLDALVTVYLNRRAIGDAEQAHSWLTQYLLAEAEIAVMLEHLEQITQSGHADSTDVTFDSDAHEKLTALASELRDAWHRLQTAREALAATGARFPSRSEATRVIRVTPPSEARRVWWRWPWG
ncbi:MAG: hypothetical protein AAF663_12010 [Planctomycetota bacterium]